ncbi:MAG: FMN-binding protein [Candidatus Yonathbacteria bacterium]|nr:FMN-binding protein [Candidatus Yonathbacteria bacterium]
MSPFQKNLQHFLVFFFTAISVVLVALGIMRAKQNTPPISIAPNQGQPTTTPSQSSAGNNPAVGSVTITGKTYQTPYGTVVAGITVTNGTITAVTMPHVPNSPPSIYAEPYLISQALTSGSANIQGVSGATYTSLAFKSSLENAIAQANAQGVVSVAPATSNTMIASPAQTAKPSIPRVYRDDDWGDNDKEWDD